jgi:hypothetical protein
MRVLLMAALLSSIALAGCVSSDSDGDDGMAPEPSAYVSPGIPTVDAQATVDLTEEFVTSYSARVANNDAHKGARDWLAGQYEDAGLEVYRQKFTHGIDQENILGILWGEVPNTWVIVGGHYDVYTKDCSYGEDVAEASGQGESDSTCANRATTQGAYDDGSGTIQTLMLGKAYAAQYQETGIKPYYTMVFAAFDGEERGLQGSKAVAGAITGECDDDSPEGECIPRYEQFPWNNGIIEIAGMVDLDMAGINWPGTEAPLYFDTNSNATRERADQTRKAMNMPNDKIKYQGISLGRSDYHWFYQMGVPTAFMISSFEEFATPGDATIIESPESETCDYFDPAPARPCRQFAYPFWHAEDTMDTMTFMAGDEESLVAGFQTVLDLAVDTLHFFAMEPTESIDSVVIE